MINGARSTLTANVSISGLNWLVCNACIFMPLESWLALSI
ncbi:hypothetical protein BMETH_3047_0 [methanotrophic bacterial endosymbiont of Bathymodiolus sp.]|nr:hypothetical protein BMETH_3047_0 [methanotrophic bacterial endosymbiont of Bathymodiolus sp.]